MEKIASSFPSLKLWHSVRDNDKTDQLHHFLAVTLLLMMAVVVTTKELVGDPINCWVPPEFTASDSEHFINYIHSYCWITRMYHVTMDEAIPIGHIERQKTHIGFYRWVVVMSLFQALLFYIPRLMWKTMSSRSAINVRMIVQKASDTDLDSADRKEREETLSNIAISIDECLNSYRKMTGSTRLSRLRDLIRRFFDTKCGSYLFKLYLAMKVLNLVNVVGQFVLLGAFLNIDYFMYGCRILFFLTENGYWLDMEHFPRISLCDFQIRQLENIQNWTVQCVLSINLFIEKLYAVFWFIFAIITIATVINLLAWSVELLTDARREAFLYKYKEAIKDDDVQNEMMFGRFCREYLRGDGLFLMRMIDRNTTYMISQDVLSLLWHVYRWRSHKLDDWNVDSVQELLEKFWKKKAD